MTAEEFKDWLKANGWYIAAGGAIIALGTGAVIGYWYGGAVITLAGECGSALLTALQRMSMAFTMEGPWAIRLGAFFGAAAIERAKHF